MAMLPSILGLLDAAAWLMSVFFCGFFRGEIVLETVGQFWRRNIILPAPDWPAEPAEHAEPVQLELPGPAG